MDLSTDPPPDIVVEIDISRARLDKLELYVGLSVPELWRYDGDRLTAFRLEHGRYAETAHSVAVPWLPIAGLERPLAMLACAKPTQIASAWQQWLDTNAPRCNS
ncbi:MAG: Uma2 family endonuclease [Vulcanimicrobiaceae bacterium]